MLLRSAVAIRASFATRQAFMSLQPPTRLTARAQASSQMTRSQKRKDPAMPKPLPPSGPESPDCLSIDGSLLEGGGQILRNAAALAAITGTDIKIENIRAGRKKPGLRPQHLMGLQQHLMEGAISMVSPGPSTRPKWEAPTFMLTTSVVQLVRDCCSGQLLGDKVDSMAVALQPRQLMAGLYKADTGTAGSCSLLAQAGLPCLIMAAADSSSSHQLSAPEDASAPPFSISHTSPEGSAQPLAPSNIQHSDADASQPIMSSAAANDQQPDWVVDLHGGTNAAFAPPVDYLQHVVLPSLSRHLGVQPHLRLIRRGFYPRGGGHIQMSGNCLPPGACLPAFNLTEQGKLESVQISAFTAGRVAETVADRMLRTAEKRVKKVARGIPVECTATRESHEQAIGDGAGLLIVGRTDTGLLLGGTGIAEKGKPAEAVADEAADSFCKAIASGACVDEWLEDQLIIFMALAKGISQMLCQQPTLHARTAMVVAEQITSAKFTVTQQNPSLWLIRCTGASVPAGHFETTRA